MYLNYQNIPSRPNHHRSAILFRLDRRPKVRQPRELPFGTKVTEADGNQMVRDSNGLWAHGHEPATGTVSTLDLNYPLTINA